jgi:hypothetical protein
MGYSKENLKPRYEDCSATLQQLIDSFVSIDDFNDLKPQVDALKGQLVNVVRLSSGSSTPTTNVYNNRNIHIDESNKLIKWYTQDKWVSMRAVLG